MKIGFGYEEILKNLKELENKETYNIKVENVIKSINDLFDKYKNGGIYQNL